MNNKYKEEQVWKYITRIGEESSTITILKVEKNVIHIKINDINIISKTNQTMNKLGHAPIDVKSLDESVTEYVGMSNQELDLSGYYEWKRAKGGVFTITVSEIVDYVQKAMNS